MMMMLMRMMETAVMMMMKLTTETVTMISCGDVEVKIEKELTGQR